MDCSHFWGRGKWSVRYDPENCDALCRFPCHAEWENEKGVTEGEIDGKKVKLDRPYRAWKKKQLGQKRFDILEVKVHQTVKRDYKMDLFYVQNLIKSLDREEL